MSTIILPPATDFGCYAKGMKKNESFNPGKGHRTIESLLGLMDQKTKAKESMDQWSDDDLVKYIHYVDTTNDKTKLVQSLIKYVLRLNERLVSLGIHLLAAKQLINKEGVLAVKKELLGFCTMCADYGFNDEANILRSEVEGINVDIYGYERFLQNVKTIRPSLYTLREKLSQDLFILEMSSVEDQYFHAKAEYHRRMSEVEADQSRQAFHTAFYRAYKAEAEAEAEA